jgi:plastocyanin
MRNRTMKLMAGLFLMAVVAAACGTSSTSANSSPSTSEPPASSPSASSSPEPSSSPSESGGGKITIGTDLANDHGSADASGMSSLEVELDDEGTQFYFKPTVITGTPGESLTLDLTNDGSALHNFSLTEQSIDTDVQPGGTGSVTVTIPQSGFVEFFCKYHKPLGMVGELKAP